MATGRRPSPCIPLLAALAACGKPGAHKAPAAEDASRGSATEAVAVTLPPAELGMADLSGFAYRTRPGHASFRAARVAEKAGDWAGVAAACEQALAADPDHLDAAYLLAVARAKLGRIEQILPPLQKAVTSDFGKWAQASLDQPALQKFLATPTGKAWRERVAADRERFTAALARAIVVTSHGDLFAFDRESSRWFRLTRTGGAVVAQLPARSESRIAYITRQKIAENGKHQTKVGIGLVDLATGKTRRQIAIATTGPIRVAYNAKRLKHFIVRIGKDWLVLDEEPQLRLVPTPPKDKVGAPAKLADATWLDISGRTARLGRATVANISADWDEQFLASAIRIGTSHRVVAAPSPGLIDSTSVAWSPDRTQLAFVALADDCKPGMPAASAFVADAATGVVQGPLERGAGLALEWVSDRKLAIAGDTGVAIFDLDAQIHPASAPKSVALAGADGLVAPRRKPKCTPEEPDVVVEPVDEPAASDDEPASEEPGDAGVGD